MDKFYFSKVLEATPAQQQVLADRISGETQTYFVRSWTKQGWDGQRWSEVKRRIRGTPEYMYPKKKGLGRRTRAILVRTGDLRRAVNQSARDKSWPNITFEVNLPYAAAHNDGDESRNLPRRRFMGGSAELNRMHQKAIGDFVESIFKPE